MKIRRRSGRSTSLKRAQITALIASALIPMLISAIITMVILTLDIRRETEENIAILNSTLNYQIDQFFDVPTAMMHQLRGIFDLFEDINSHELIDRQLDLSLESFSFFNKIMILDKKGKVIHLVPYNNDFLDIDQSQQPFYRAPAGPNGISWSEIFISSLTGRPLIAATIDFRHGKIVGFIDIDHLIRRVQGVTINNSGFAVVTDKNGTLIVHPEMQLMEQSMNISNEEAVKRGMAGEKGQMMVIKEGFHYLCAYSQIGHFDWVVLLYQDRAEIYARIIILIKIILLVLTGTIGASVSLAILISRRILGPLNLLTRVTQKIEDGDYNFFRWKISYSEFDSLADNFTKMINAVKHRQEEVNSLRLHLSSIMNSMPSFILGIDSDFRLTFWNEKLREEFPQLGKNPEGEKVFDSLPFLNSLRKKIVHCLYEQQVMTSSKVKLDLPKIEGYFDIDIFPLGTEKKKEIGIRIDNVTDIVNSELMVQQADRLTALGKLSAGISHDLNNLLTPILGYGELLTDRMSSDPEGRTFATEIQNAALRAQKLVRQLLVFSKKQKMSYTDLEMKPLLEEFKKLIRRTIPENIEISYEIDDNLPLILGDPGQLEQVIMNLAINSRDAMPGGGTLKISSSLIYLSAPLEKQWNWKGEGYFIRLKIADSGQGMDEAVASRIFEPFYSTKGERGTGLGLSMVYGIIEQHNGFISVHSKLGRGTEMIIYIPVLKESSENPPNEMESETAFTPGRGSILLVEDDKQVREMIETFLRKWGYQVHTASNGEEALPIFAKHLSEISLILTDVIMPRMSGAQMVTALRQEVPALGVIFMSGYTDNELSNEKWNDGITAYIEKPFTMAHLYQKITSLGSSNSTEGPNSA